MKTEENIDLEALSIFQDKNLLKNNKFLLNKLELISFINSRNSIKNDKLEIEEKYKLENIISEIAHLQEKSQEIKERKEKAQKRQNVLKGKEPMKKDFEKGEVLLVGITEEENKINDKIHELKEKQKTFTNIQREDTPLKISKDLDYNVNYISSKDFIDDHDNIKEKLNQIELKLNSQLNNNEEQILFDHCDYLKRRLVLCEIEKQKNQMKVLKKVVDERKKLIISSRELQLQDENKNLKEIDHIINDSDLIDLKLSIISELFLIKYMERENLRKINASENEIKENDLIIEKISKKYQIFIMLFIEKLNSMTNEMKIELLKTKINNEYQSFRDLINIFKSFKELNEYLIINKDKLERFGYLEEFIWFLNSFELKNYLYSYDFSMEQIDSNHIIWNIIEKNIKEKLSDYEEICKSRKIIENQIMEDENLLIIIENVIKNNNDQLINYKKKQNKEMLEEIEQIFDFNNKKRMRKFFINFNVFLQKLKNCLIMKNYADQNQLVSINLQYLIKKNEIEEIFNVQENIEYNLQHFQMISMNIKNNLNYFKEIENKFDLTESEIYKYNDFQIEENTLLIDNANNQKLTDEQNSNQEIENFKHIIKSLIIKKYRNFNFYENLFNLIII